MEDIIRLISSYGVSFVIVAIFLWDYVVNKKNMRDTLEAIKDTNTNILKILELLQVKVESIYKNTEKN